jgi:hypothetical protein
MARPRAAPPSAPRGALAGAAARRRSHVHVAAAGLLGGLFRAPAPPPPAEDAAGAALLALLVAGGAPPPRVYAAAVPGAGRGLVAGAAGVARGAVALRVPSDLIVTPAAAAARSPLVRRVLDAAPGGLPAWSVLAVWLAELLASGREHPLAPYAATLPATTGCVLEWAPEEVAWLEGSHLHALALELRGAADASWVELAPRLRAAGAIVGEPAVRRALALLLSRLVRLDGLAPPGAPPAEALVPFADLANHDSESSAFLEWDASNKEVVLRAEGRRLAPGDQLCASYGEKTSGELLLSYGFAPAEGANPHDGSLLRIAAAGDVSATALAARGLPAARVFPLRLGALPRGLLRWAAFAGAEVSSAGEAGALLDALALEDGPADDARLPPELRLRGLAAASAACRAAAEGYRVGGAAAAREAAALAAAGEGGGRRATVLRVLAAEVRVLRRAEFLLGAELREARRAVRA